MNVRPLQDRILVRRTEEVEKTRGGIIIPDSAKERPLEGSVIINLKTTPKVGVYWETYGVNARDSVTVGVRIERRRARHDAPSTSLSSSGFYVPSPVPSHR